MEEERLSYRWPMAVLAMLLGLFVTGFSVGIVPPLFSEIKEELLLSHTQIGVIWGVAGAGTFFTALTGGMLGDRYGPRKVMAAGVFLAIVFCALRGVLDSFWGLSLAMFLLGTALGLIAPNVPKAVAVWFGRRELGTALGVVMVGGASGNVIALMLGVSLSSALGGWKNVMLLTGGLCLAVFIMWVLLARERPAGEGGTRTATARPALLEGFKKVVRLRELWLLCGAEVCVFSAAMGFMGHFPENTVARGASPAIAGVLAGVMFLTMIVSNVIGPRISDRIGLRRAFIWPALLVNMVLTFPLALTMGAPLIVLLILNGAAIGTVMPLLRAMVVENRNIGPLLAGSALGLQHMANRVGAVVGPMMMGWIQDATGGFWQSYVFIAALLGVGAVLIYLLQETGMKARKRTEAAGPG
jgi:MFS family permease